jgi:hypothetical protein
VAPWVPLIGANGKPQRLAKRAKYEAMAERALSDLAAWAGGATEPATSPAGVVSATL